MDGWEPPLPRLLVGVNGEMGVPPVLRRAYNAFCRSVNASECGLCEA